MDRLVDRPETQTCAKGTLRGVVRTGVLLMGAVVASVFLVDAPTPVGGAAGGQAPSYVPASDKWIELGAAPHSETQPLAAEFLHKT